MGGKIVVGFYVLKMSVRLVDYEVDEALYPYFVIQYFLDRCYITLNDITHLIKPNNLLPADLYKKATLDLYAKLSPGIAKSLANPYVGLLGRHCRTDVFGGMTTSLDLSEALHGQVYEEVVPTCIEIGGVYYTHYEKQTPLHSNHLPIWMHILWINKIAENEKRITLMAVPVMKSLTSVPVSPKTLAHLLSADAFIDHVTATTTTTTTTTPINIEEKRVCHSIDDINSEIDRLLSLGIHLIESTSERAAMIATHRNFISETVNLAIHNNGVKISLNEIPS